VKGGIPLELKKVKKSKDTLEFIMAGERHTFPQVLKKELLNDSKVEFAAYKLKHPLDRDASFIVKVKKGSPKSALGNAAKRIGREADSFHKELQKAVK